MPFTMDPGKGALLIMDYQSAIVDMFPIGRDQALQNTALALQVARKAGLKVIFVVIGFREGFPEVSPNNKSFHSLRGSGRFALGSPGVQIHPSLAPLPQELVVTKHRVSAFSGSDLDMLLRAGGVESLVLAGIASSGVVLSTLRQAADLDFRLAVLRDACLDADAGVHACLMDKVFPRQAEVIEVSEFAASLGGA
jgi:nicotinamidase-related amidase